MKKLILLAFVIITVFNCGDEIEFNTPAFQGDRGGRLWRAESYFAAIDANGFLTLTGVLGPEKLELKIPSTATGTYVLGNVRSMEARFTNADGVVFSTNNEPSGVYPEIGEIRLNEVVDNTFTGTFRFNAFDPQRNVENFTGITNDVDPITSDPIYGGVFYKIPLTSGAIITNPITCTDITAASDAAEQVYTNTTSAGDLGFFDSVSFETACNAYVEALNLKRDYCSDLDGSIQAIIDSLDCVYTCDMATANVAEALSQLNNATMGNYITLCNQYAQYLQEQIDYCGDDDGSIQAIIDDLQCGDDDNDGIPNTYEDFNNSGDLNDDDTDSDLIPDYLDEDDDDDGVPTIDELQFDTDGNPADTDGDGMADYFDTDDDGDGVDTIDEDINGDGNPANDDTDGDGIPNYLDMDDDGDGVYSVYEDVDGNGTPANDDTDSDSIPNYLDIDDDGDSIHTIFELFEDDVDGNPVDAQNFDNDTLLDYLDNDDDDDGILTINENPDPNGDGDPSDAANTDADSSPDYLDAV